MGGWDRLRGIWGHSRGSKEKLPKFSSESAGEPLLTLCCIYFMFYKTTIFCYYYVCSDFSWVATILWMYIFYLVYFIIKPCCSLAVLLYWRCISKWCQIRSREVMERSHWRESISQTLSQRSLTWWGHPCLWPSVCWRKAVRKTLCLFLIRVWSKRLPANFHHYKRRFLKQERDVNRK